MGVTTWGDADKSGKNIYLLVVMRVRLSQNIDLVDLTNHNLFKNVTAIKYGGKVCAVTG